MLETLLKQAAPAEGPPGPGAPPVPPPARKPGPPDQPPSEEAEVPFIEVGPKRVVVEASPSVLASIEAARQAAAPAQPAPVAPSTSLRPAAPAAPAKVVFRPLPERPPATRSVLAPELVAYHAAGQPASAPYGDLLDAILARRPAAPGLEYKALLFTASVSGAGTTTALLNVAISAARRGSRVLVIDANLRRPAAAERLALPDAPGLREVLAGALPVERALQHTAQEGLLALAAGGPAGVSGAAPGVETFRSLLRGLRQRFDLVLVDGPRWDGCADVAVLAAACDAVYLVLPGPEGEAPGVDELLRVIPEQGARLAGCIVVSR
jgi:Mrp family chromosome partitioning ATPase